MTSSSKVTVERGLDTMFIVYGLLQNHPAAVCCGQFLRSHSGWFASALALFEAKVVLTKVYDVDPVVAEQKLIQFANGPVTLLEFDSNIAGSALQLSNTLDLELNDAVLLILAERHGAKWLATEDQKLAQLCSARGITPISPFDATLRQQVGAWESAHLPPKGLPRVLRRVYQWLHQHHSHAASDFWSHTSAGSHLP